MDRSLGEAVTASYPLVHDRDAPRQRSGSIDCSVYLMRFMEQLLDGEKLRVPEKDVPYLRLKYAARILLDGSATGVNGKGGPSSTDGV